VVECHGAGCGSLQVGGHGQAGVRASRGRGRCIGEGIGVEHCDRECAVVRAGRGALDDDLLAAGIAVAARFANALAVTPRDIGEPPGAGQAGARAIVKVLTFGTARTVKVPLWVLGVAPSMITCWPARESVQRQGGRDGRAGAGGNRIVVAPVAAGSNARSREGEGGRCRYRGHNIRAVPRRGEAPLILHGLAVTNAGRGDAECRGRGGGRRLYKLHTGCVLGFGRSGNGEFDRHKSRGSGLQQSPCTLPL